MHQAIAIGRITDLRVYGVQQPVRGLGHIINDHLVAQGPFGILIGACRLAQQAGGEKHAVLGNDQRLVLVAVCLHPVAESGDLLDKELHIGVIGKGEIQPNPLLVRDAHGHLGPPTPLDLGQDLLMDAPGVHGHRLPVQIQIACQHGIQPLEAQRRCLYHAAHHHLGGGVLTLDERVELVIDAGILIRGPAALIDATLRLVADQPHGARMLGDDHAQLGPIDG